MVTHRWLLPLILVIVTVRVKIILRRRQEPAPPAEATGRRKPARGSFCGGLAIGPTGNANGEHEIGCADPGCAVLIEQPGVERALDAWNGRVAAQD